jgi:hypothetical protein
MPPASSWAPPVCRHNAFLRANMRTSPPTCGREVRNSSHNIAKPSTPGWIAPRLTHATSLRSCWTHVLACETTFVAACLCLASSLVICLVTWQRLFCRDLVRRPRPVAPGVSQAPGRPSECLRSAGSARVVARNVLAVRRLFVSAKTETNTKSAQVRICRPIGSTSAHPGRKNTTASASTPETAGLSASALPVEAFQTLIAMPSRKRRLRFGLAAPPVRRSDFLRPPNLSRAGPLDS